MINRRDLMRWMAAGTVGSGAAGTLACVELERRAYATGTSTKAPDFTAAFLTDPHIFADKGAPQGARRAFENAVTLAPEVVITGGDLVFDILEVDRTSADAQFDLLDQVLEVVDVPIYHTLGNHDCFGVHEVSGIAPSDPLYGKSYFVKRFGLERSYYSFDHEGWHFVVLDTVGIVDRFYRGWVDEEQLAWLDDDLAAAAKPTVVVGHIPLFSNYIEWNNGTSQGLPDGISVVNSHEVARVIEKHPVRLVLAGHLHVNETFIYKGITFANIAAVSGNWWDGARDGFEEGFALLEFRGDQVTWRYVDFGWNALT